jgi:hypothetical protein
VDTDKLNHLYDEEITKLMYEGNKTKIPLKGTKKIRNANQIKTTTNGSESTDRLETGYVTCQV